MYAPSSRRARLVRATFPLGKRRSYFRARTPKFAPGAIADSCRDVD